MHSANPIDPGEPHDPDGRQQQKHREVQIELTCPADGKDVAQERDDEIDSVSGNNNDRVNRERCEENDEQDTKSEHGKPPMGAATLAHRTHGAQ